MSESLQEPRIKFPSRTTKKAARNDPSGQFYERRPAPVALKKLSEDWTQADMQSALSKESLSIAADNYQESLSAVRRTVLDAIKMEKVAA
jgi:hypothetical protein